jgi:hypothetical protein
MELSMTEIENLFVDSAYTREEILRIFRAYDKSRKPVRGSAQEVFDDWKLVMEEPTAILDLPRKRLINKALSLYTMDDLKLATRGCLLSPWHMGTDPANKSGRIVNFPEVIFKDASHIENFISLAKQHSIQPDAQLKRSSYDGSTPEQFEEYTEFIAGERI